MNIPSIPIFIFLSNSQKQAATPHLTRSSLMLSHTIFAYAVFVLAISAALLLSNTDLIMFSVSLKDD